MGRCEPTLKLRTNAIGNGFVVGNMYTRDRKYLVEHSHSQGLSGGAGLGRADLDHGLGDCSPTGCPAEWNAHLIRHI